MHRSTTVLAGVVASVLSITAPAWAEGGRADAPSGVGPNAACPASTVDVGPLPRSRDAIAKSGELNIVAFGSSSTAGWMSSDAGHSYPAVTQSTLEQALPHAHVAVINRGVGGQDAAEELARIDADVTSLRPSLVIWQVGANGALRRTDPELFRRLVSSGLERLKRARVDVILMDNQRSPMIMNSPDGGKINGVLATLAQELHVGMFSRWNLMETWKNAGEGYDRFVSSDGLHHNDHGYRCLGLAVAHSIVAGLDEAQAPVLVSSALPPAPPRAPAAGNTPNSRPGAVAPAGEPHGLNEPPAGP